jgi:peptidoglycan lytic transglycosylase
MVGMHKLRRLMLRRAVPVIAFCLCYAPILQAATIEQQRGWFVQARQALQAGQMDRYASLKKKLAGYPLTPYLDIWQAWKQFKDGHDAEVAATLERFADVPESNDLRKSWVESLAKRGHWRQVMEQLDRYPRLRKKLPDIAMMADWQAGDKDAAMQQFSDTWVHSGKSSSISRPLHKAWLAQGHPTNSERWSRIIRLAQGGEWERVGALSAGMGKRQRYWLRYWQKLQAKPEAEFSRWPASLDRSSPEIIKLANAIIDDGMKRLSRKDPLLAHANLQKLRQLLSPDSKDPFYEALEQQIALSAARQHLPVAAQWLGQLPEPQQNMETMAWEARLYMLQHDWKNVLQTIQAMPPEQRQEDSWQYWEASALEAGGDVQQSTSIFSRLASNRSYYGFLSAEHIDQPYRFDSESLDASPALVRKLSLLPGLQRAHEWLALENNSKAEREWNISLAGSDARTWKAAMALAVAWNWPDQAIRAASMAGAVNALEERFPLQYEQDVMRMAKQTGLSPSSIWGVIRQESIFDRQALSPAGGRGLMQLLPRTARMVARQMGLHTDDQALFSPSINIRLGSRYLADLKSRFDDNLVLAAAAYNAGPDKVNQWLDRTPYDSAAIWVEAIPFNETRRYVEHVMAFTVVYQWRKKQQPISLSDLMNNPSRTISMNDEDN